MDTKSMKSIFTLLLLASSLAFADSTHECQGNSCNNGGDGATQEQSQQSSNQNTQTQGDSSSSVGAVSGGNVGDIDAGSSTDVSVRTERSAPNVTVFGVNGSAAYLKCLGGGGSVDEGGAGGWYCWLQRDLYAEHRATIYALGGNPGRAAVAYCSQKLHAQDFDSHDNCLVEMELIYKSVHANDPDVVYIDRIPDNYIAQVDVEALLLVEREREAAELRKLELELQTAKKQQAETQQVINVQQQQQQMIIKTFEERAAQRARARAYTGEDRADG